MCSTRSSQTTQSPCRRRRFPFPSALAVRHDGDARQISATVTAVVKEAISPAVGPPTRHTWNPHARPASSISGDDVGVEDDQGSSSSSRSRAVRDPVARGGDAQVDAANRRNRSPADRRSRWLRGLPRPCSSHVCRVFGALPLPVDRPFAALELRKSPLTTSPSLRIRDAVMPSLSGCPVGVHRAKIPALNAAATHCEVADGLDGVDAGSKVSASAADDNRHRRDHPQRHPAPAPGTRLRAADLRDRFGIEADAASRPSGRFRPRAARPARRGAAARRRAARARRRLRPPARSARPGRDCARSSRATTGSDAAHMSKSGSSVRATPSTTTIVFCTSSSSGRVCMSKSSVTSKSRVSSWAIEISLACWPWIGSPIARSAWAKSSTVCVRRARSRPRNAPRRCADSRGG